MPDQTRASTGHGVAFFLVLALYANLIAALSINGISAREMLTSFYLIAFAHMGASLYLGGFDRIRTLSWLLLVLGWTLIESASFARYVIPTGQLFFWLTTQVPWAAFVIERLAAMPALLPTILLAILALDAALTYRSCWRERSMRQIAILSAAAIVAGLLIGLAVASLLPKPQPISPLTLQVVPSWHVLPFYTMLRAVPDKATGLVVAFAAITLPAIWPWMKVERLHMSRASRPWIFAWLMFVAAFVALAYLGAQAAEPSFVLLAQILTAYYFLFLLAVPPILNRLAKR